MKLTPTVKTKFSNPDASFLLKVKNSKIVDFTFKNKD